MSKNENLYSANNDVPGFSSYVHTRENDGYGQLKDSLNIHTHSKYLSSVRSQAGQSKQFLTQFSNLGNTLLYEMTEPLLEALAKLYDVDETQLKQQFKNRNDGFMRIIHYHSPKPVGQGGIVPQGIRVKGTVNHTDENLLSFGVAQSKEGLYHVDTNLPDNSPDKYTVIPARENAIMVDAGKLLEYVTKDTRHPVPGFEHTVFTPSRPLGKTSRVSMVGFLAQDYQTQLKTWGEKTDLGTVLEHHRKQLPNKAEYFDSFV